MSRQPISRPKSSRALPPCPRTRRIRSAWPGEIEMDRIPLSRLRDLPPSIAGTRSAPRQVYRIARYSRNHFRGADQIEDKSAQTRSDLEQHISRRVQHPTVERPELQNWLGKMPTYSELIDASEVPFFRLARSASYLGENTKLVYADCNALLGRACTQFRTSSAIQPHRLFKKYRFPCGNQR